MVAAPQPEAAARFGRELAIPAEAGDLTIHDGRISAARDWRNAREAMAWSMSVRGRGGTLVAEGVDESWHPSDGSCRMKTYHLAVIPADGIGPEVIAAGRTVLDGLARHHGGVAFRYGDSGKPDGGPDHAGYAPRAMALDQVEVMRHLGLDRFAVAGHDRGGRVAHRMALDHPDRVSRLAVPTIGPAGE